MYKVLNLVVLMMFSAALHSKSIYLIRHAEKVNDGSKDPVLTAQGQLRAQHIAEMLSYADIQYVYSTDYQRTQLTAKPMADCLGVDVISYDPRKLPSFADLLKQQKGNALIVGHSNTTPELTKLLSGLPVKKLSEDDYDHIFQVILQGKEVEMNLLKSLTVNELP